MEKKRAIVIGASSGIGREVARLLMAEGWTLGVAARRTDLLQTLGDVQVEQIDVTSEKAPERLRALIDKVGGMDLFFYASGIGRTVSWRRASRWRRCRRMRWALQG